MIAEIANSAETIAVLIGASSWPKSKGRWPSSDSFQHSAADVEAYFRNKAGLGIQGDNVLSLFDDERAAADVDESIDNFLFDRNQRLAQGVRNIFLFYTGHGCFTESDNKYALALRSTRIENIGSSAFRMSSLARTLSKRAKQARKFLILDCCYAAAAAGDFLSQSDFASRMETETIQAMAESGTALLCASSPTGVAKAPLDDHYTMFSGALLSAVKYGSPTKPDILSFNDIAELMENTIRERFREEAVRPEIHFPDQHRGSLASIRVFPNAHLLNGNTQDIAAFPLTDYRNTSRVSPHLFADEYVETVADNLSDLASALGIVSTVNREIVKLDRNAIVVRVGGLRLHSTSVAFWQSLFDAVSLSGHRTSAALLRYIASRTNSTELRASTLALLQELREDNSSREHP